jgi:hypothetical protein
MFKRSDPIESFIRPGRFPQERSRADDSSFPRTTLQWAIKLIQADTFYFEIKRLPNPHAHPAPLGYHSSP